ncbi:MAG: YCF48-related protein, partial [Candidatus Sulfomarinibacteraceae bacterium]
HGRIHRTDDGGRSWVPVTRDDRTGKSDLHAMTFAGQMRGWAAGSDGTILHSNDGGHTWRRQHTGARGPVTDIFFVDLNRGWALVADRSTSSSLILATANGGTQWLEDRRVDGELLHRLFFVDEDHGWAVGTRPEHGPQALLRYRAP